MKLKKLGEPGYWSDYMRQKAITRSSDPFEINQRWEWELADYLDLLEKRLADANKIIHNREKKAAK